MTREQILEEALNKIALLQPVGFNTEKEHWEDGNFDDSFEYGIEVGEYNCAEIARKALKDAEEHAPQAS